MKKYSTLDLLHWPEISGDYKIIQVKIDDVTYLRIGHEVDSMHKGMLEEMLRFFRIDYDVMRGRSGSVIPMPSDRNRYWVLGMGWVHSDNKNMTAEFYDESFDYEIGIDANNIAYLDTVVLDRKLRVRENKTDSGLIFPELFSK